MKVFKVLGEATYAHQVFGQTYYSTLAKAKAAVSEFFDGEPCYWYTDGRGFHWMHTDPDHLVTVGIWEIEVK